MYFAKTRSRGRTRIHTVSVQCRPMDITALSDMVILPGEIQSLNAASSQVVWRCVAQRGAASSSIGEIKFRGVPVLQHPSSPSPCRCDPFNPSSALIAPRLLTLDIFIIVVVVALGIWSSLSLPSLIAVHVSRFLLSLRARTGRGCYLHVPLRSAPHSLPSSTSTSTLWLFSRLRLLLSKGQFRWLHNN